MRRLIKNSIKQDEIVLLLSQGRQLKLKKKDFDEISEIALEEQMRNWVKLYLISENATLSERQKTRASKILVSLSIPSNEIIEMAVKESQKSET